MTGDLLEIRGLRIRFPVAGSAMSILTRAPRWVEAVAGVDLSLRAGITLGLVGESGSGKTTLGRAILGLTRAAEGTIRFEGRPIPTRSGPGLRRWRRDIAMMFQDPVASLSPRLSVGALITEPFRIHAIEGRNGAKDARRLLDMVGLPSSFASRYPHELSGGQARRVGVARSLALSPKLIVADEPTAGLDVSVQGEILNLIARLQRELGLTYLVISHNLAVVRHMCDRVATLYLGRLVEEGPTDVVFRSPAHPYTHGLIAAQPQPDPDLRRKHLAILGEVPSLRSRPSGCEFHTRCPQAQGRCRLDPPTLCARGSDARVSCHFPLPV